MIRSVPAVVLTLGLAAPFVWLQVSPLPVTPTELQLPGTQPLEVSPLNTPTQCDNCHGNFDPVSEPARPWMGSMMAQAVRDPVFWATVAIAEQDYPGSGEYCLRCHTPRGWLEGRATSASGNGNGLGSSDIYGVECAICHQLVDPDGSEHPGTQNAPYIANDGGTPPVGYYGNGSMVIQDSNDRLGPYGTTVSTHTSVQSQFHRSADLCGTCHDVSNPVVGDLAHGNGAQLPLLPGTFSGVPGTPVTTKAAFNNFPFQYGVVERTFSEHRASALDDFRVRDFATLPAELQRGGLAAAYGQALLAGTQGDHADGTQRFYTCQTCHMMPVVGKGAKQNAAPVRTDIGQHDLTGGSTWMPELIQWADQNNRLPFGGGLSTAEILALDAGAERARALLRLSAALDVDDDELHVVNLTGHKLITGYPEGRRMWLNTRWYDRLGNVLREDGAYGPISVQVQGQPLVVESLLDPNDPYARVYETKYGLTQQWANQLIGLGWPASLPLSYDRLTGAVTATLGQLAAQAPGAKFESFHFVLLDTVVHDSRIPPYGMAYDEAQTRNILPVPATQYGDPGPGGIYEHYDDVPLQPPAGAVRAEFELLYQSSSWEYIQFLLLANDGSDPLLGTVGQDVFDGWQATGMSPPEQMATATWCSLPGTGDDLELESGVAGEPLDENCSKVVTGGQTARFRVHSPNGTLDGEFVAFVFELYPASGAMPLGLLPGIQLDHADYVVPVVLSSSGDLVDIPVPPGNDGNVLRAQALTISTQSLSGFLGTSAAHDITLR